LISLKATNQFDTLSEAGNSLFQTRLAAVMLRASIFFFIFWMASSLAWSQAASTIDDASKGRHLAVMLCTGCHVVTPGQPYAPTLNPPAASFESIAQRVGTTVESLRSFLTTTHQGLDNQKGMPDPMLVDFQIKELSAYILSLRK
jgi:mono/diheme cytochrome c family protein